MLERQNVASRNGGIEVSHESKVNCDFVMQVYEPLKSAFLLFSSCKLIIIL